VHAGRNDQREGIAAERVARRDPAPVAGFVAAMAGALAVRKRRDEEARIEPARLPDRRDPVREVGQRRQVGRQPEPPKERSERAAAPQPVPQPLQLVRPRRSAAGVTRQQDTGLLEQLAQRGAVERQRIARLRRHAAALAQPAQRLVGAERLARQRSTVALLDRPTGEDPDVRERGRPGQTADHVQLEAGASLTCQDDRGRRPRHNIGVAHPRQGYPTGCAGATPPGLVPDRHVRRSDEPPPKLA
jgi:hypothetical protein